MTEQLSLQRVTPYSKGKSEMEKNKSLPHRADILGERIWRKMVHLIDKLNTRYFRQSQNNKTENI